MAEMFRFPVKEGKYMEAFNDIFRKCLDKRLAEMVLVPQVISESGIVQQTLVRHQRMIEKVDPLKPFLPVNSATLLSRLTRGRKGGRMIAVMRPCEIRAFVELVKLNQGSFDDLIIAGIECLGTFPIGGLRIFQKVYGEGRIEFTSKVISGDDLEKDGLSLRQCCRACRQFTPEGADIKILIFAMLGLEVVMEPSERSELISKMLERRKSFREKLLSETRDRFSGIENLIREFSLCINCHNCMEVCPMCYCKQCVFDSSTFEHEPIQYLRWAERKGAIKMPTDTIFFHLTRMAHMSLSCVGCGQCSMACPMDIPVADIFLAVATRTQGLFDYEPGRDKNEILPIAQFREKELDKE